MKAKFFSFLKWFIAVVLIVGAVVLTVFVFFKKNESKQVQQVDLNNVLTSSDKQNFDSGLDDVIQVLSSNGQADWFVDLKTTADKLDESLNALTNYYINSNFVVSDNDVGEQYSSMINTRNLLNLMLDEYKTKSESAYFAKDVGANDIYSVYSSYLVKYAKFIQAVDNNVKSISGFDSSSDIKFSVIDLQTRIVVSTFSSLNTADKLVKITSNANIQKINSYIVYENSYITGASRFSKVALLFIQNYERCNKSYLAEHFVEELNKATSVSESSSAEQKSAYYFKRMF